MKTPLAIVELDREGIRVCESARIHTQADVAAAPAASASLRRLS